MCIWLNPYHVAALVSSLASESYPAPLCVPPEEQTTVECSGQGYRPVQVAPTSMSDTYECFTTCICCGCAMDESLPPYSLLLSAMLL